MRKLDDRTGSGSEVVTQSHILWISARRQSSCQTLPSDDHFALSETRYVAVRSRSLESSGTVSDVTKTIHPYHFSSMLMELGRTTTMTRCALDPDGTLCPLASNAPVTRFPYSVSLARQQIQYRRSKFFTIFYLEMDSGCTDISFQAS